jgi:hypothetical protein
LAEDDVCGGVIGNFRPLPTTAQQTIDVGSLLVITGPPGAGKSTLARLVADTAGRSVLVEGDAFFAFLASGRVDPWLSGSHEQNTVVTKAAASAAGRFARGGYATVYDGVVGPGSCRPSPKRPSWTGSITWYSFHRSSDVCSV